MTNTHVEITLEYDSGLTESAIVAEYEQLFETYEHVNVEVEKQ